MTRCATAQKKASSRGHRVADAVSRFCRQKSYQPKKTYGHVLADKLTELSGDNVYLDATELTLIELKRCKIISGRRMVDLLGRHQREVRG